MIVLFVYNCMLAIMAPATLCLQNPSSGAVKRRQVYLRLSMIEYSHLHAGLNNPVKTLLPYFEYARDDADRAIRRTREEGKAIELKTCLGSEGMTSCICDTVHR